MAPRTRAYGGARPLNGVVSNLRRHLPTQYRRVSNLRRRLPAQCHRVSSLRRRPPSQCYRVSSLRRRPTAQCHRVSSLRRRPTAQCHRVSSLRRRPPAQRRREQALTEMPARSMAPRARAVGAGLRPTPGEFPILAPVLRGKLGRGSFSFTWQGSFPTRQGKKRRLLRSPSRVQRAQPPPGVHRVPRNAERRLHLSPKGGCREFDVPPGGAGGLPLYPKTSEGGAGGIVAKAKTAPPFQEGAGQN